MRTLWIDIETYSAIDLKKCGVYKYAECDTFEILLFGYAFDNGEITVIDLTSANLPEDVRIALFDENVVKKSWNANFERICLEAYFHVNLPINQWSCTAVLARYIGLPASLDGTAKLLGLDAQKDAKGKNLIKYFSMPCKASKKNGGRLRNYPHHDLERWQQYINYCQQDVLVEREISNKLGKFKLPDFEQKLWELDQRINDDGLYIDVQLLNQALTLDALVKEQLSSELKALTGLDNPNSASQLKKHLSKLEGYEINCLDVKAVEQLIDEVQTDEARQLLILKQQLSKTSTSKYQAMQRMLCRDGRVRGFLLFYGANRTGRWAGRGVQVHNLPRGMKMDSQELELAIKLVKTEQDIELLDIVYPSIPSVLSTLIRPTFLPDEGDQFCIADFSAIEARVLAWLAGEQWKLDVFRSHGKIYEASAAQMFNVPIEEVNGEMRQHGKVAELGLGYGMGISTFIENAKGYGVNFSHDGAVAILKVWRTANPEIVKLWRRFEKSAIRAVRDKVIIKTGRLRFIPSNNFLFIELPSKRRLAYFRPQLRQGTYGEQLYYIDAGHAQHHYTHTYGGKLVENIIQAIARDCLAVSMIRLHSAGYKIRMHIHDEIVLSVGAYEECLADVCDTLSRPIAWAEGLPLSAEGFYADYYQKG